MSESWGRVTRKGRVRVRYMGIGSSQILANVKARSAVGDAVSDCGVLGQLVTEQGARCIIVYPKEAPEVLKVTSDNANLSLGGFLQCAQATPCGS